MSHFPPISLIEHFIYLGPKHVFKGYSLPGAMWACESPGENETEVSPPLRAHSPVRRFSVLAVLTLGTR